MAVTGASEPRHAGALHPGELARAAVMAALCVATAIIAAAVSLSGLGGIDTRNSIDH
jgi:energy-coupling factor transport system ATP-binding protein